MPRQRIHSFQAKANAQRNSTERLADWMTRHFGSMRFLMLNMLLFISWIVLNIGWVPMITPFDPYPFSFLTMIVSLEAIALAIVVLISQNRAERVADIREEIDLQLDVITEEEVTKVMALVAYLAEQQGFDTKHDEKLQSMLQQLDVDKISRVLEKQLH